MLSFTIKYSDIFRYTVFLYNFKNCISFTCDKNVSQILRTLHLKKVYWQLLNYYAILLGQCVACVYYIVGITAYDVLHDNGQVSHYWWPRVTSARAQWENLWASAYS